MAGTVNLNQSTDFKITTISITTKFGTVDIRNIFDELNIYDSLLQPCMSGNILVTDSIGLAGQLNFDGSEYLNIEISKAEDYLTLKKRFHIYKLSNRTLVSMSNEAYLIHFVSDEFTYSEQQTVSQYYGDTYSNVVRKLLNSSLKIPANKQKGVVSDSYGTRKINVPLLKPLDAAVWCSKRALDSKGLPTFVFFENSDGYNFTTISKLIKQNPLFNVDFSPKNISQNVRSEFLGVRAFEVVSQHDFIDNTRAGVFSGTFVGFDPLTRTYIKKKINLNDMLNQTDLANKNVKQSNYVNRDNIKNTEMYDSKRVVFPFAMNRATSPYIKSNDPTSIQSDESPEKWYFQREAIFQNLTAQRVKMAVPGNFALTSGKTLNLYVPTRGVTADNGDALDSSLYGKYLILATRHIIKFDKHETVVEVVTDSTNQNILPTSTPNNAVNSTLKSWLGG